MEYFELFDISPAFQLETGALKRRFIALNKQYHPDYHTLANDQEQEAMLEKSTLVNQAYKTLSDPDLRMKYILDTLGVLGEEGTNALPQAFLVDMMDINEQLMELQFDPNPDLAASLQAQVNAFENRLWEEVKPALDTFDEQPDSFFSFLLPPTPVNPEPKQQEVLLRIKDYYLKKRYLLRIRENSRNDM